MLNSVFKTIGFDKINKWVYNKFLEVSDNISVTINKEKIVQDEKWDGFKGYNVNTELSASSVYKKSIELLFDSKFWANFI
jgi:hypothetical protein